MCERRACSAERKQPRCSVRFGRTEPSPSGQDGPPSKPNRACKPPSRARAEGLLGLLGLITGLLTDSPGQWTPDTGQDSGTVDSGHRTEQRTVDSGQWTLDKTATGHWTEQRTSNIHVAHRTTDINESLNPEMCRARAGLGPGRAAWDFCEPRGPWTGLKSVKA